MRRMILLAVIFLLGLAVAAPAFAQTKDPFEPGTGSGQTQETGGGDSSGDDPFEPGTGDQQPAPQQTDDPNDPTVAPTTAPTSEPAPQETVESGRLSNTGADVTTWGGIGYLLIVLGGCALIVGWMFAPVSHRRRR